MMRGFVDWRFIVSLIVLLAVALIFYDRWQTGDDNKELREQNAALIREDEIDDEREAKERGELRAANSRLQAKVDALVRLQRADDKGDRALLRWLSDRGIRPPVEIVRLVVQNSAAGATAPVPDQPGNSDGNRKKAKP